jgi:anti-sigma-K factor RskA
MIPRDPDERDVLAGEYVLGVLDPALSREIESALASDAELRDAVAYWENKLHPLSSLAPSTDPPADSWPAIKTRLSPARTERNWWASTAPWRWSTAGFAAAAAGLLLYVAMTPNNPSAIAPPLVAVLHAPQSQTAGWVAVIGQHQLHLAELTAEKPPAAHAFELWAIAPHANRPVPLAVIPASGALQIASLPKAVVNGAALAISIEPPGGSPTGLPTGPVVYAGVLRAT